MQTADEIRAELAELYAARTALAKGERVDQVERNGRMMRFGRLTLAELNAHIQQREMDLEQATASEAGLPRRRAIGTYF